MNNKANMGGVLQRIKSTLPYVPYPDEIVYVEGCHTIKVERWRIDMYHDTINNMLNVPAEYAGNYASLIVDMLKNPVFWQYFSDHERSEIESEIIDKFDFREYITDMDQRNVESAIFIYENTSGYYGQYNFRRFDVGNNGLFNTLNQVLAYMDEKDHLAGLEYDETVDISTERDAVISDLQDEVAKLTALLDTCRTKLHEFGMSHEDIEEILSGKTCVKNLYISRCNKFYVSSFDVFCGKDMSNFSMYEIRLSPLDKAIYQLFLNHPEGINFSYLPDYREELLGIYRSFMNCRTSADMIKSVEDVTDPTKNSINEKCARIRRAFVSSLGEYKAEPYIIRGPRGEKKKISLNRDYVIKEGEDSRIRF